MILQDWGLGSLYKSISMALAKIKPQNELGDIISKPCVELNSFRVINHIDFFIFVQRAVQEWRSKFISMALVKTNPQNELGDIISEPCVELNRFRVINQIGFFIFV